MRLGMKWGGLHGYFDLIPSNFRDGAFSPPYNLGQASKLSAGAPSPAKRCMQARHGMAGEGPDHNLLTRLNSSRANQANLQA